MLIEFVNGIKQKRFKEKKRKRENTPEFYFDNIERIKGKGAKEKKRKREICLLRKLKY